MRDIRVEDQRNQDAHRTFIRFFHRAFGKDCKIVVAHHLVIIPAGETPLEIPSADTLWFDHDLMGKVFGKDDAETLMQALAARRPESRESFVSFMLDALDIKDPAGKTEFATT